MNVKLLNVTDYYTYWKVPDGGETELSPARLAAKNG